MQVGSFGSIAFEVSSLGTRTFRDLERRQGLRHARHEVLDGRPRLQTLGRDLAEVSLRMRLDTAFLADPAEELELLEDCLSEAEEQPLIIGGVNLGTFVLVELSESWKQTTGKGKPMVVELQAKFMEYA
ncbi:phage tail protein [Desulfocurvibacter africanus]|uniref:phage tail protein n=1 Tax=Desulfocurvibacter africanus TaxID=873 RepID=UPI00040992B4|nr:phage tail protein [Desulfocurvibacter africanus]